MVLVRRLGAVLLSRVLRPGALGAGGLSRGPGGCVAVGRGPLVVVRVVVCARGLWWPFPSPATLEMLPATSLGPGMLRDEKLQFCFTRGEAGTQWWQVLGRGPG